MASEARDQLRNLLVFSGFPEECFVPYTVRVTGPDERADLIVALLCVGLYPNVCFHKEKRRVLTAEGKSALIHKSSVNLINKDPRFPSPFFVFGEKLKTRAVAAKTMTMVEPIHLLLFGAASVVSHGKNVVKLDEWITLLMSHESAALVGGLRQALDDLLVRMAMDPAHITCPSPNDEAVIHVISTLVSSKATPPSLPDHTPMGSSFGPHPPRGRGFGFRGRGSFPSYRGAGRGYVRGRGSWHFDGRGGQFNRGGQFYRGGGGGSFHGNGPGFRGGSFHGNGPRFRGAGRPQYSGYR